MKNSKAKPLITPVRKDLTGLKEGISILEKLLNERQKVLAAIRFRMENKNL